MLNRKIKLVYITNQLGLGGLEKNLLDVCLHSDTESYDISIISLSKEQKMLSRYKLSSSIKIYFLDYDFPQDYSIYGYLSLAVLNQNKRCHHIVDLLNVIKPDIINFHTTPRELIIGHTYINNLTDIAKPILVFTDQLVRIQSNELNILKQNLVGIALKKFYKGYHQIYVSKAVQSYASKYNLLSKSFHSVIIENTVDTTFFSRAKFRDEHDNIIRIIYPARLSAVKGHKFLLESFSELVKVNNLTNCKLLLLGDGELKDYLSVLSTSLGISNFVEFLGYKEEIKFDLEAADIGVFPSQKEGLPLALIEMMSMSLPVLVSDIPELVDLISDNHNGLVYHGSDHLDFKNKLKRLILEKDLRGLLGINARKDVVKRFGRKSNAEPYESFYKELIIENGK
jgi:glycosyltransferase involved in cell wall biosynthesis